MSRISGWKKYILCLPLYLIPVVFLFYRVIAHPFSTYIGGNQDATQFMWYLGNFWHAVFSGTNPLVTTVLNYPHGINLMANTSLVAEAIIFGPLQFLTNAVFAYNVLVCLSIILAGLLSTVIMVKLGIKLWISILAGILLETSPYFVNQLVDGHVNLVTGAVIILGVMAIAVQIYQHEPERPILSGVVLAVLSAAAFYTSLEVFATSVMVAGLILVIALIIKPKLIFNKFRRLPISLYISTFLPFLALVLPGLLMYFLGPYVVKSSQPVMPENVYVNDFLQFVVPTSAQFIHSTTTDLIVSRFTGGISEMNGFLGILCIIAFIWAATRSWSRNYIKLFVIAATIVSILSLGPRLHILGYSSILPLPGVAISKLPLITNALPGRLMFFADVLIVIVIAQGLNDLSQQGYLKHKLFSIALILLLAIMWLPNPNFPHLSLPAATQSFEPGGEVNNILKGQPTAFVTNGYWDFGYEMGILAEARYTIPSTNVYAFPYTGYAVTGKLESTYPADFLFSSSYSKLDFVAALNKTKNYIKTRKPQYIVYIPGDTAYMQPVLEQTLNALCYGSIYNKQIIIWKVPAYVS